MSQKRASLAVVALLVVVAAAAACGSDSTDSASGGRPKPAVYSAGDSIAVADGKRFVIELAANPSTGYSWQAQANQYVEFVSSKQVQGESRAAGAPGTQRLTFRAVEPGMTTLVLDYFRPFESGVPPAQTERFAVTVKG